LWSEENAIAQGLGEFWKLFSVSRCGRSGGFP
jgi:hypothetical protein